jgi:hypothetical protein
MISQTRQNCACRARLSKRLRSNDCKPAACITSSNACSRSSLLSSLSFADVKTDLHRYSRTYNRRKKRSMRALNYFVFCLI